MEGTIPDVFGKIVSIFEKAIDEKVSGLNYDDRLDITKFYLDYMQENCQTIA
jgi:hypothetical protein